MIPVARLKKRPPMPASSAVTSSRFERLSAADFTRASLTYAKNLTQEQVDGIRYNPEHPPKLPPGCVLPEPPQEPEAKSAAPPPPEA